jgi:hypothetical protein
MKRIFTLLMTVIISTTVYAQMKKPSVMVLPSKQWMTAGGHMMQFNNQGTTENHPNYRSALESDATLNQVLVKLSGVIKDRGFTVKMLEAQLDKVDQKMADQNMRTTGGGVYVNPTDMLKMTAKADLVIELAYTINQRGPQKSVQFTLLAKDAGQGTMAGQVTGNTEPSSGSIPEEMSAALNLYMDAFSADLMKYFEDMVANGREILLNVNVTENFDEDLYTDSYGDDELMLLIEDWVADNTKGGNYNLSDATETMMVFEQTRIPLEYERKGKMRKMDAGAFGSNLAKYLKSLGLEGTRSERSSLSEVNIFIATY